MIKYLGIDYGEKRIGLALADSETRLATPFKVIRSMDEVLSVIKDEKISSIIIGAPFSITNVELRMSNEFNNFLKDLKEKVKIPVLMMDERLSSKAADALFGDKKTKAQRDTIAAMLILQNYLDRK